MHILTRIKHIPYYVSRVYFLARSWWPVWYYVLNYEGRTRYKKQKTVLKKEQARIVEDLAREGIAVAHLDDLFPGENMFARLQAYTQDRMASAETRTTKLFLKNLWDAVPTIDGENPFVKLSLDQKILGTINAYMGMLSKFYYFTLNVTTPIIEGTEAVQSQRWHRDPEDKKLCKIFIYLSDVDESAGPFTYVRGSQYGGRWHHIFPQRPPSGGLIPSADDVAHLIPKEDIFVGTGHMGTIIFCDTSGIHRGGYATKKERIMFTGGYCSKACAWPIRYHRTSTFEQMLANADDALAYAFQSYRTPITAYFFRIIKPNFKYEGSRLKN